MLWRVLKPNHSGRECYPRGPPRANGRPHSSLARHGRGQYLCRHNGSPKTAARPGMRGLSPWPEDFRAGLHRKSASPAWGWRVRSVRPGALHRGCRLCFQHLQGNPAISRAPISLPMCLQSCKGPSWEE